WPSCRSASTAEPPSNSERSSRRRRRSGPKWSAARAPRSTEQMSTTDTMREAFDLLITGGTVIDGTGAPRFDADVGVRNGRIVFVGPAEQAGSAAARRRVDARGLVVAPGFIDCHTHDDRALLSAPDMTPKVSQGVTTVVTGNCGVS